jgi:hypothetical protein
MEGAVFSADFVHAKPIIIEEEESSDEDEDEGAKLTQERHRRSSTSWNPLVSARSVSYHQMPSPSWLLWITRTLLQFLWPCSVSMGGVLTSTDQQFNLAGYLLHGYGH